MSKRITVEELAANLREHLAEVKAGESLTIVDEGKMVASLEPPLNFVHRGMRYPFRDLKLTPAPKNLKSDPVELLIEDRERR